MTIQPLPVPTKIFGGESLHSYASRHANRNGTTVEEIERALYQSGIVPQTSLRRATERMQTWRELGALHESAFTTPTMTDGAKVISRSLCMRCSQGANAAGLLPSIGWVCARHRRWLGTQQQDIHDLPELIAAERHYRRVLFPRRVLVKTPVMRLAHECATVGVSRNILATRSRQVGTHDLKLLTYPETIKVARFITNPGFNKRMLAPNLGPQEQRTLAVRVTAGLFPGTKNSGSRQAGHRIAAVFNRIVQEVGRARLMHPDDTEPPLELDKAWTIWIDSVLSDNDA